MPWTMEDYPASFQSLDKVIRKKALEIANKMVQEGYEEGRAIPIAINQIKRKSGKRMRRKKKWGTFTLMVL